MNNTAQHIQAVATNTALTWLNIAAKVLPKDRAKFMEDLGRKVSPMFNRDVRKKFLAEMAKGKDAQQALQSALIQQMTIIVGRSMGGLGIDKTASSTSNWQTTFATVGDTLSNIATTGFGVYSEYQQSEAAADQASWQRNMQEQAASHQREMERLAAERATTAPTFQSPSAPDRTPLLVTAPTTDNTGLYVVAGIGAAALLGGALLLKRK